MLAAEGRFQVVDLKRFGLEAPPGFEPGMEVLQTYAAGLRRQAAATSSFSGFQLVKIWATISKSLILNG